MLPAIRPTSTLEKPKQLYFGRPEAGIELPEGHPSRLQKLKIHFLGACPQLLVGIWQAREPNHLMRYLATIR